MANARSYACASHLGGKACNNNIMVRRDLVEDRLLAGIRSTMGSDEVLDEIERRLRKALKGSREVKPDLKRVAELKVQVENLVNAIAAGGMRASHALGRKLADIEAELAELETVRAVPAVVLLVTGMRNRIKNALGKLTNLLEQDPERARAALRDAGVGPIITLRPATDGAYLNAEYDLEITPLRAVSGASETLVAGV
jgi:site-specific DNA recombinase